MSTTMSRFRGTIPTTSSTPIDQSFLFNPTTTTGFLTYKKSAWNLHGRSFQYLSMSMNLQTPTFVRQSNVNPLPEPLLPSGAPSSSLRNWIARMVLTFILPFFTYKWGSLLLLKNQVDEKIKTTEHVVKAIKSVAERIDKVIDGITDSLPEGSKLKKTLEFADMIVEGVAKIAHVVYDIIKKVRKEGGDKLESLIHHKNSKEEISQEHEPIDNKDHEITTEEENYKK